MSKQIKFTPVDEVVEIIDCLPYGMRYSFINDCIKVAMSSDNEMMKWYKERYRKLSKSGSISKLPSNLCEEASTRPEEIPVKQNLPPKVAKDNNVAQNNIVHTDEEFS